MHYLRRARSASAAILAVGALLAHGSLAAAKTTKLHAFGMRPNSNFEIRKNNGVPLTARSSSFGSIIATIDANPGDRFTISTPVPVPVTPSLPSLVLAQNIPNPFNPSTRIPFTLHANARVRLSVFDVRGAHVVTLLDENLIEGEHVAEWAGEDAYGQPVASGVYFYSLSAGGQTLSRKMTLLK